MQNKFFLYSFFVSTFCSLSNEISSNFKCFSLIYHKKPPNFELSECGSQGCSPCSLFNSHLIVKGCSMHAIIILLDLFNFSKLYILSCYIPSLLFDKKDQINTEILIFLLKFMF